MPDRLLDRAAWPRREVYDFFSRIDDPFYMVTFQNDVTAVREYTKRNNLSFYYTMVYLCTAACNAVPAFRQVIRSGQVWELEARSPSFTDLHPGSEVFHIVTMPCAGTLAEFCQAAAKKSAAQTAFLDQQGESDALIYFSCLPWVELTALTNERGHDLDDSVPRIAWGRYTAQGGRLKLGLSLEVNHRLIDGVHIGQFAQALERRIAALGAEEV